MAVALYARVSTVRQAENEISIPDQLRQMREWCERNGLAVAREYVEPGATATDDRRPVFQAMIADTLSPSRPYEAVVVHSLSRWFRDMIESGIYERRLRKAGVKLISITQITSDDSAGEMARRMFGLFDEYQSKEIAKHTLRGMRENARQGFFNGARPPYGYRSEVAEVRGSRGREKKRLVPDPAEAEVVRLIYRLYLQGLDGRELGMKGIAGHLDARGLLMRGRAWRIQKVQRVLSDPTYRGEHLFNRTSWKDGQAKPASEWVRVAVEPLVTEAQFEEAQRKRHSLQLGKAPVAALSPTLLTGLLKCGHCGAGMTLATGKSGRYRYYKCTTRMSKGAKHCDSRNVPMAELDRLVVDALAEKVLQPERIRALVAELRRIARQSRGSEKERGAKLKRLLREAGDGLSRLCEAVEKGLLSLGEILQKRIHTLETNRDTILLELARARGEAGAPLLPITPRPGVESFARAMRQRLRHPDSGLAKS